MDSMASGCIPNGFVGDAPIDADVVVGEVAVDAELLAPTRWITAFASIPAIRYVRDRETQREGRERGTMSQENTRKD